MDQSKVNDTSGNAGPEPGRLKGSQAVTFVLMLASFATSFAGSSLNVSIVSIGADFPVPAATLSWLVTAFGICTVSLGLPMGRLGDLSSRRTLLKVGLVLFILANLSAAFAPSMNFMIALRIIQGFGSACMMATNQAILVDAYPPQIRGRMLGFSTSAVYIGLATGPVVGGFITQNIGWRVVFLFIATLGALALLFSLGRLPANSSRAESGSLVSQLDIPGMLLYSGGLATLTWSLNKLPGNLTIYIVLCIGVSLLAGFVWWELRAPSPLLNMNIFKSGPSFILANLAAFMNYSATFAVTYLLSIYLQRIKGFGADISGIVLVTAPIMQATVSMIAGRLSDSFAPHRLASIGCSLCATSLLSFVFVTPQSSMVHIFANLVLLGMGIGFFASPNTNVVMNQVPRSDLGFASSFLGTMRSFGQVTSMAVIAMIMTSFLHNQPIQQADPTTLAQVMRICFIIFSVICVLGALTSMQQKGTKRQE